MQHFTQHINSEILRVINAIEEFDGSVDPAFDNGLDELERQFAELRIAQFLDLN